MANTTVTVSTSQELYAALAKCTGGETILLEGGDYGALKLTPYMKPPVNLDFASTVTIASADPTDPAVFSQVGVTDASNLAFDGITFDYTFKPTDPSWYTPFNFSNCDGLTIKNCTFDGDTASGLTAADNGYAYATGLQVRGSSNVVIEDSEFYEFALGLTVFDSSNTVVKGNELHSMRRDGMNFNETQGILIEDNYIHDFKGSPGSGDHCDMIQFWTTGTNTPSTDIVIRDNVLDIGNGTYTQSIYMRNEIVDTKQASFSSMAYRNVLIEDNTITNGHLHGITVGETIGLTISQNTVAHADGGKVDGADSTVEIPKISVAYASTGVTIVGNVTSGVGGWSNQAGWTVKNNAFVQDQDPYAPGYYSNVFVSSSLQPGADGSHRFVALAGSMIDTLNAGSQDIQPSTTGLQVLFHVDEPDAATRVFDAATSTLNGASLPAGTTYLWDFGDGTTAIGQQVSHSYADGGDFTVKLTVILPNGTRGSEVASLPVEGPDVLTMDSTCSFTAYDNGSPIVLGQLSKMTTTDGIQLGASGVAATVARVHVADVVGADDMTIAFTLDADKAGTSGELFRLHGSFVTSVTKAGELQVQIMRDGAPVITCVTKGAGLNSTINQDHDIVINLDNGKLEVWVDDTLDGQIAVPGVVGGAYNCGSQNLTFGNPWGQANFNGDISAFEISVDASDFPATPQTQVIATGRSTSSVALDSTLVIADLDDGQQPADQPDAVGRAHDPEDARDDAPMGLQDRFLAILEARLDAFAA